MLLLFHRILRGGCFLCKRTGKATTALELRRLVGTEGLYPLQVRALPALAATRLAEWPSERVSMGPHGLGAAGVRLAVGQRGSLPLAGRLSI